MDYNLYGGNICFCRKCNGIIYVVKKGDTLYSISGRYGVTVNDILNANRYINIYNLQVGDRLCIPVARPRTTDNISAGNPEESAGMMNPDDIAAGDDNVNAANIGNAVSVGNWTYGDNYGMYDDEYAMDYAVNGAFENNEVEVSGTNVRSGSKITLREMMTNSDMTIEEFARQISAYIK